MTINFTGQQLVRDARRAIIGVAIFVAACLLAHCGSGCMPLRIGPPAADIEAAYNAEIRQCSMSAKTKEAARLCRIDVNRRYGLCNAPWPAITPCDE